jgi:SNF2 family DNA or RNA helicase
MITPNGVVKLPICKTERKTMSTEFLHNYPFKNKPFLHQQAYLERFWNKRVAALFADMGTGKSFMVINNIAILYDQGLINAVLIVAPKGVYRNWHETELPKHLPAHIVYRMALWNPSPKKAQKEEMERLFEVTEDLKILIMNIEALSTEKGVKYANRYLVAHEAFMAIDESTTIKTPTAARAKNAAKIGKMATFRRIMTGSPVTKSPMDLYQQCAFLSEDCLDSRSYYAFQARYAVTVERSLATHSFKQVVGYRHLDELQEKINKFAFRVTKEECLDLPDKMYTKREVDLTEEQIKAYNEMKTMALSLFKEGMASTVNALTQIMRLHQIVCGHVKLDDGTVKELPNNRIKELLSVVEESSGKIIIWANYRHDIEAIKLALQKEYGMNSVATYYGDTEADDRQRIVLDFQDPDSELRFFVGNPRTGGYGLTLTAANVVVYFSNSFDLEVRLQSEDRAHRIGQTKKVTYIDLISPKTVDEKIVQALRSKIDIANQVMGEDLKAWLI